MSIRFHNSAVFGIIVLLSTGACALDQGGVEEHNQGTPIATMSEDMTIVTGEEHACILLPDGAVRCWGNNDYGQLGHGQPGAMAYAETASSGGNVPLSAPAIDIEAGSYYTCALLETGAVECWGSVLEGELANYEEALAGALQRCRVLESGAMDCFGGERHEVPGDYSTQRSKEDDDPIGEDN